MSTAERKPVPSGVAGVSMRDLLAACAAAKVVSTPPQAPPVKREGRRGAGERCRKVA
ncbi:hypothetical protein IHE56_11265 [Streptomyces sp. ID01-12c]|uniref:hypothetical protein n=1 Tax=Streptomyces caniscabiei TaxID=2746961 RepID=UPI0017833C0F|nr:hypothetical protein [Streptomyces caniscabiei]MBD9702660.1 hypothetical protein [Streptomyces caniscabiei]MDX3728571.1 hypothetical protein [Streptomyces caniscabiei]